MSQKALFIFIFCFFFLADLKASLSFSVMTYNLENLFDTKNDPKTKDEEFLPLKDKKNEKHKKICKKIYIPYYKKLCLKKDWSEKHLKTKIKRIGQVIEKQNFPEIILFQEVENLFVLKALNQSLKKSYSHLSLIEDTDPRGIDLAVLSRFPIIEKKLIPVRVKTPKNRSRKKRGILSLKIRLKQNQFIQVLNLHMPSQRAPQSYRKQYLQLINRIKSKMKDQLIILGGDFNINKKESHLYSILDSFMLPYKTHCKDCKGTYYYKKTWSFLDNLALYVPKSLETKVKIKEMKVVPVNPKKPEKFSLKKGVSDHFPLVLKLQVDL